MIINLTKKKCISHLPIIADNFILRTRGMIGRNFQNFDGMVFNRCNSIHTLFMSIDLDVVFINRENVICGLQEHLRPWRPMVRYGNANAVIELPAGTIAHTGTSLGDVLDLNAEMTWEAKQALKTKEIIDSMGTAISYKESK